MSAKTKRSACLAACVAAASFSAMTRAAILDGVQPAALDQPQINMLIYYNTIDLPQIGQAEDPLGGLGDIFGDGGGTGGTVNFFNVQAYLDTGASSVLISNPTAAALHVTTETVSTPGGVKHVIYSDVGVAGTDDFSVAQPLHIALAHYIPGVNMDQFDSLTNAPVVTPYVPINPPPGNIFRAQVGPFVPTIDDPINNPGSDPFDQLIAELSSEEGALDVVGMPAMKGKVMVIDPTGVKNLGLLFSVLGGVLDGSGDLGDISDLDLNAIQSAGVKTYLYDRATAPAFDPSRSNNPGIPTTQLHVQLSYGSFDRFTEVTLEVPDGQPKPPPDPTLPSPTLAHNPFIGKNPVAILDGTNPGNAPGITIFRTTTQGLKTSEGNWLLDTGAAASIISEDQALAVNVKYADGHRPGAPDTADPILVDAITGATVPDQFTLTLGGIGGQEVLAGFFLDKLKLPTIEGLTDDNQNLYYTHVPV
ncbi:MAG TPA: hypothetical protein VHM90_22790, partial [Phycisphaerae bacterium]|nr:hypothetical protein [Phycisphaerae bacterium]